MENVIPIFVSGLELVQISSLPDVQTEFLSRQISRKDFITVSTGSGTIDDCIKYDTYKSWLSVYHTPSFEQYFESQL